MWRSHDFPFLCAFASLRERKSASSHAMNSSAPTNAWKAGLLRHESVLLFVLLAEVLFFNSVGHNFATSANVANIVRQSVEIGLLAIALTPIILTGGIDL